MTAGLLIAAILIAVCAIIAIAVIAYLSEKQVELKKYEMELKAKKRNK